MKKLLLVLILFVCFSVSAYATQTAEQYYEIMLEETDNQTKQLLENIGIENGSVDEILNLDFKNIVTQFLALCRNEMKTPIKTILNAFVLMLTLSVLRSIASSNDSVSELIHSVGSLLLALMLMLSVTSCISDVLSACFATADFTKLLIPILGGIVAASGKPATAVCFQSFCFSIAQVLTSLFRTSLPVVSSVYITLSVCGSISSLVQTDRIAELIKKGYTYILSFTSVLFSALLSVKSVIAGCADTVAVKGIKFVVGNAVPVVGGALSDALNSVVSSLALLKSSVGILAIIILVFINIPTLIELLMWKIALKLFNTACAMTGSEFDEKLSESFDGLMMIMSAVLFFQVFLYIIAVAILVIISGMG